MAGRRRRRRRPHPGAFLLKLLVVALALSAMAWQLHGLNQQVADAESERDRISTAVEEAREKNEALKADISAGMTPEKVEEIARNELGLVHRDEYVFYNTGN